MGSGSASLPAKRPMSSASTEIQATTEPTTNPNPKSQPKRSKKKHPMRHNKSIDLPIPVPAGHASFRLLCNSSRIGGVIGKSGSVINALRIATASKIHVDTAAGAEVSDRVVTVVAPAGAAGRVLLRSQFGGEFSAEVTKAQEALLRVYDRILEVAAESGAVGAGGFGVVSCRMLTDAAGARAVIGKGGKIVERIKKETGTRIKVLRDDLPSCASSTDEMIEIEGDVLGVKKALVSVSHWLQACSLGNKAKSTGSFEAVPAQISPDLHSDHFSQRNFVSPNFTSSSTNLPTGSMNYPGSSVGYTSGLYQSPLEAERRPSVSAKAQPQKVSFKIICSNDKIGGLIGKGGSVVRILQDESGARVSVGSSVAECDDRVITISASEDPESRYSPAQKAVVMVFSKSEQESKSSSITARLVVLSNQVGCILGKGGVIISEIRKITGASIRIIGRGDQVPKCLSANDEVVQISGDFSSVQDALYNLTGRLRANLLTNSASSALTTRSLPYMLPKTSPYRNRNRSSLLADTDSYGRIREPDSLVYDSEPVVYHINGSPYVDVTTSLRRHENSNGLGPSYTLDLPTSPEKYAYERPPSPRQYAYDRPPSPRQYAYERPPSPRQWGSQMASGVGSIGIPEVGRGSTSLRGGLELGSGNKSAIVTNTTVEIIVPEHVIGSVYGENGNNLTRLRQISGARVIVHEPRPGTSDRVIVISGTPDETQAAQSLLHAFILTGTS